MSGLRELFTRNLGYKLLSLLFAVLCWAWVQGEQRVEDRLKIPIQWSLPEGLSFVEAPLESTFVTLEGPQAVVRALPQQGLHLTVDLAKASEGEVTVDLADRAIVGLPSQVRVKEIQPSRLKLQLDRIRSRRVRVVPVTKGDPAPGYRLAKVEVVPERVDLNGPGAVLQTVAEVKTDAIDVGGLREDTEFEVGLATRRSQLSPAKGTRIKVKVHVEATVKERKFDAPLRVEDPAWATPVTGVSVTVTGAIDAVDGIVGCAAVVRDAAEGEARWGAAEGPRLDVSCEGADGLEITAVEPDRVPVSRQEAPP